MLSIICPYNNKGILESLLQKSLKNQKDVKYETILIEAKQHGFGSAAETLNYAGSKATGDYLIFVHQDIVFENAFVLKQINDFSENNEFGIAGVAGCIVNGKRVLTISNICHGLKHEKASNHKINVPKAVISLDECLLIVPRKVFNKIKFSDIGKTWHLYGTDYSIQCKNEGYKVLVFPITNIWHASNGISLNANYFDSIQKLAKMYSEQKSIITIFGIWPTNLAVLKVKCWYRKVRLMLRGN